MNEERVRFNQQQKEMDIKTEQAIFDIISRDLIEEEQIIQKSAEKYKLICSICQEEVLNEEIVPLDCAHFFHRQCLSPYIKLKVEEMNFPIVCPEHKCGQKIPHQEMIYF